MSEEIYFRVATESDVPGIRKVIRSAIEGIASRDYSNDVSKGDQIFGFSVFFPEAESSL